MLTPDTAPQLRVLRLEENVPDDCDMRVVCPELREASRLYLRGQTHMVDAMLAAATKLERFDSYKLWSNDSLAFESPNLKGDLDPPL